MKIFGALILSIVAFSTTAQPALAIEFNHAENGALYFDPSPGEKMKPILPMGIYEAELLGKISAGDGETPYFLFSGRPCSDCLRDRAVYVVRPSSHNSPASKPMTFTYPGKLLDPKTRSVFLESRGFFGQCLKSRNGNVLVIFQKERVDRRNQLQSSVYIAEPGKDHLNETLLERHLPRLNDTLLRVKKRFCHEISGRNRYSVKKAFEIPTRFKQDDDDAGESDDSDKSSDKSDDEGDQPSQPTETFEKG